MLLSSSQELHSRKYLTEWPSHCPQQTDTDALRSGSEAGHSGHTCASPAQVRARCHLCQALCSAPGCWWDESGVRLTSDNTVTPSVPLCGGHDTDWPGLSGLRHLARQSKAPRPGQAQLARSHAPALAPTLCTVYTDCTVTVHTLQPLRVSSHRLFTILSFGSVYFGPGDVIITVTSLLKRNYTMNAQLIKWWHLIHLGWKLIDYVFDLCFWSSAVWQGLLRCQRRDYFKSASKTEME